MVDRTAIHNSQTGEVETRDLTPIEQAKRDADRVPTPEEVTRAVVEAAKEVRRNTVRAHPDNRLATWGELRPILEDAGVL